MNKREVTTGITEIQRIMRNYYKELYANKMGQPRSNGQILRQVPKRYLLRLNQEEKENMNRPITSIEIESAI